MQYCAVLTPAPAALTLSVTQRNSEFWSNKGDYRVNSHKTVHVCHTQESSYSSSLETHDICTCRYTAHTRAHTAMALKACYESWLFIHPSILAYFAVRLHWSVQTTKQNVYGFVMSRLSPCGVKEGIDYVENCFFSSKSCLN